jgi:CheY-like chemotaxis protein
VLLNLLGNAVKFTEHGVVTTHVRRVTESPTDIVLYFAVRDTGIGIAPEAQARLFDPFVQADQSTTRKYGGTGLGLAISRRLVEAMNGELRVESTLGAGSIFSFEIRLEKDLSTPKKPGAVAAPGADGTAAKPVGIDTDPPAHPLRILLAEDNAVNRKVAITMLGKINYIPDIAENGLQVLEKLASTRYDLIFMDCQMPEMDGFEATRRIRAMSGPEASTRIVAITANALQGDRESCLNAGMNDYIAKPIRYDDIKRAIREAVEARENTPA